MSSVTRPRGQLPARVYWARRALVVVVLAVTSGLVVVGLAAFLGTDGQGPGEARQAAAGSAATTSTDATPTSRPSETDASSPAATPTSEPSTKAERRAARRAADAAAALVAPTGPCEPRTVRITSRVADAFAATRTKIPLDVTTLGSEACSWTFSADTVALDITSGLDRIWSSVQCPDKLPEQEMVLVPGTSDSVTFTWSGRRSDADCSRAAGWPYPGFYHVLAAAEGGEPHDQQFEMTKAPDEISTRTPKPKPRKKAEQDESAQAEAQTSGGAQGRTESEGRDGD